MLSSLVSHSLVSAVIIMQLQFRCPCLYIALNRLSYHTVILTTSVLCKDSYPKTLETQRTTWQTFRETLRDFHDLISPAISKKARSLWREGGILLEVSPSFKSQILVKSQASFFLHSVFSVSHFVEQFSHLRKQYRSQRQTFLPHF